MGTKTDSIWSKEDGVGTGKATKWYACPISTLNTALNNNVQQTGHSITNLKLHINADYNLAGLGNVYFKYGFGTADSVKEYLLNETKMSNTPKDYPSGGVDITKYLKNNLKTGNNSIALKTDYGNYLTFCIYTENILSKTFFIKSVVLEITTAYTHNKLTLYVSPEGSGTVTGGGWCKIGEYATLTATPKTGYEFDGWYELNSKFRGSELTYKHLMEGQTDITARFKKLPPKFTSAEMKYLNKQISVSNKVICNEGFILSVGIT